MNEAEAALSGRISRGQKLIDLLLGVFDETAVQIQLRLDRKIAPVQALGEALIHVLRHALHILIGKLQRKDAATFHQIPKFIQAGFVIRGQSRNGAYPVGLVHAATRVGRQAFYI
jgi:hypothetical protein